LAPSRSFTNPKQVVANGQFFIVKRSAFEAISGYASIKGEVLDDMALARALTRSGFTGQVANGADVADCRMYSNRKDLNAGYKKSLWSAFGTEGSALLVTIALLCTNVLPFVFALSGKLVALIASMLLITNRLVVARFTRSSSWSAFLHPFSILYLNFLTLASILAHKKGETSWKGRKI
jgi:hypothetical protein